MTHMDYTDLLQVNRPVLYLHSEEQYMPSHPDYYLSNADLFDSNNNMLLEAPTQAQLYDYSKKNPQVNTYLKLHNSVADNVRLGDAALQSPIYGLIRDYPESSDMIYLIYIFFYPYNGWYNVLDVAKVGTHDADIECMMIEINKETQKPVRYYYGAHGSADGTWVNADSIEYKNGRPVVYIAKHGHGTYYKPGIHFRLYGVANDETDEGKLWDAELITVYPESDLRFDKNTQGWIYYTNNWEPTGISGATTKHWYKNVPQVSLNATVFSVETWTGIKRVIQLIVFILYITCLYYLSNLIYRAFSNKTSGSPIYATIFVSLFLATFTGIKYLLHRLILHYAE